MSASAVLRLSARIALAALLASCTSAPPPPAPARVVSDPSCFGTPYGAVERGVESELWVTSGDTAPERFEDAFAPFSGVSIVQSQTERPREIARVRRGLVGSHGGGIPSPYKDGSGWGWSAIDLDRREFVTVEQQIWKDPKIRQPIFASAFFAPPGMKGAIARVWIGPDRVVTELVRIHALQEYEVEAAVCVANAAWALDQRDIPPTMVMYAIVGKMLVDAPRLKTMNPRFSLAPAWAVFNANRLEIRTDVPHWLPVPGQGAAGALPNKQKPAVSDRRKP